MSKKQDERLEALEERLSALYANATNDARAQLTDFMAQFEEQDFRMNARLIEGEITPEQYGQWRNNMIIQTEQYRSTISSLTDVLVNTDVAAMAILNDELPLVIAESYNFVQALGYAAADNAGLTSGTFQVYNARSVQSLLRDNPDLLPEARVNIPEDQQWNRDRLNREITQSIISGDSMDAVAERLARVTTMDQNSAIRNARTMMTGAENMGRAEAADDLREQGVPVEEVWSATIDNRTRDTHLMMDGTTRDENGYFGAGIIATPLEYPGDPNGDPEEVYNCRCRLNIQVRGIDHSRDAELYEQFMRDQHPDDWTALQESNAESGRARERAQALERQARLRAELPSIHELTPADHNNSGLTGRVTGQDITETWQRRSGEYEYEINDVINAQGFDGLPRVVDAEEFDRAVAESNFIAQRTYSAPDQETLDAYRAQLYSGDWYVDCGTGGAQYGQGMYCAADYTGNLSQGIQMEMAHYQELGHRRFDGITPEEERPLRTLDALPEEIASRQTTVDLINAISTGNDDLIMEAYRQTPSADRDLIYSAWHDSEFSRAVNYTETLTLAPDANIITYDAATELFNEYREQYSFDVINREARADVFAQLGAENIRDRADYLTIINLWEKPGSTDADRERREALEARRGITADALSQMIQNRREELTANEIHDLGSFCASRGYDAINAEGHGASGSYTVILNRTACIFRRDET